MAPAVPSLGMERSLLIVEDDEATATFLADNLRADGYKVAIAEGAGEGYRALEVRHPALLLLDLALGDGHGLDLLDRIRMADGMASRIDPGLPVIVLTGRSGEADRVRGFERGADDYVVKPFSYGELLGRVRAVLRRAEARPRRGVIRVADLSLDPETRMVMLAGKRVHLSAKEFALLQQPSVRAMWRSRIMSAFAVPGSSRCARTLLEKARNGLRSKSNPNCIQSSSSTNTAPCVSTPEPLALKMPRSTNSRTAGGPPRAAEGPGKWVSRW